MKFEVGQKVLWSYKKVAEIKGCTDFGFSRGGMFYVLQGEDFSEPFVRKEEDLTLAPDPKLEAARKLVEAHEQYRAASVEYEVARLAWVKLAGDFTQPIYNAGRLVQQADSQKED